MGKIKEFIKGHKIKLAILAGLIIYTNIIKTDGWIEERAVQLVGNGHSCSGEQVHAPSGADYILTAAHCSILADKYGKITVKTEDGRTLTRRIVAEDAKSDLLLLEGLPNLRGLSIASVSIRKQSVRTFTHGRGFELYQTEGALFGYQRIVIKMEEELCSLGMSKYHYQDMRDPYFGSIEKVCVMDTIDMGTTALIVPGSSGGPVVNLYGDLVGVVSAGDGTFGFLVSLKDIKAFVNNY